MHQLAIRFVRERGSQCVDTVEVCHQIGLRLRAHPSDRGLHILERSEELMLCRRHAASVPVTLL